MSFKLYNTMTNKKETLRPQKEGAISIYLCGPTVYDFLHIGNFRGAITFNLLRNWLEREGNKVKYVYNYTDVDDKIIKKAMAEGVESKEISERFIKEFEKDFTSLGLTPHDENPKVTEYMPEIIQFVEDLIQNGSAYEVDGEVFYSIDKFSGYGKLSKKKLDELEAGNRVEVDQRKNNPYDFVLWKPSKKGEPSWDSPWGKGRPGWHIECSAMIQSIFNKETIDIHGGGIDLIFPHHENEIAQGEGRTGECYCNYWMHNNFINMSDQKMSKSLGNVVTARSFMTDYHPEILKYLFLSVHYRSMLTVSDERIIQVISALDRIYTAISLAEDVVKDISTKKDPEPGFSKRLNELSDKIKKSLNDDLNSAEFVSYIFEGVRAFNALGFKNKKWNEVHSANSALFLSWIKDYGSLAALFQEPASTMLARLDEIALVKKRINKEQVEDLIGKRLEARNNKDWSLADQLRDQLVELGIEVHDGGSKKWSVKK